MKVEYSSSEKMESYSRSRGANKTMWQDFVSVEKKEILQLPFKVNILLNEE